MGCAGAGGGVRHRQQRRLLRCGSQHPATLASLPAARTPRPGHYHSRVPSGMTPLTVIPASGHAPEYLPATSSGMPQKRSGWGRGGEGPEGRGEEGGEGGVWWCGRVGQGREKGEGRTRQGPCCQRTLATQPACAWHNVPGRPAGQPAPAPCPASPAGMGRALRRLPRAA